MFRVPGVGRLPALCFQQGLMVKDGSQAVGICSWPEKQTLGSLSWWVMAPERAEEGS